MRNNAPVEHCVAEAFPGKSHSDVLDLTDAFSPDGSRKVRTAAAERRPITSAKTVTKTHEKDIFSVLSKNRKVIAKRVNRQVVSNMLLFLGYRSVPRSDSRKIDSTVKDALIILAISTTNR